MTPSVEKIPYNKPACTNDFLIEQLRERGLTIENPDRANRYLNFIGYYRLSAYFLPYQFKKDRFRPGVDFNDILNLYIFDRKLKLVLMDAIERIEVAVRSSISNHLSLSTNNPHWFLDESHFDNYSEDKEKSFKNYQGFIDSIDNSLRKQHDATPLRHYYSKYSTPKYPPCWVLMEFLTLGQISKIYSILKTKHKKKIAKKFRTSWWLLEAVLLSLTVIRNKCAHHQRIWNVNISYPPSDTILKKIAPKYAGPSQCPCVAYFMIWYMLNCISNNPTWGKKLMEQLIELDKSLFHKIGLSWDEIYAQIMG